MEYMEKRGSEFYFNKKRNTTFLPRGMKRESPAFKIRSPRYKRRSGFLLGRLKAMVQLQFGVKKNVEVLVADNRKNVNIIQSKFSFEIIHRCIKRK